MSASRFRSLRDYLATRPRRADLSVAAYCSAFGADPSALDDQEAEDR